MRTTLSIDPEILDAAKHIAAARRVSIGEVISELARRGLEARAQLDSRLGFPIFKVPAGVRPLTPAQVRQNEDDE